MRDCFLDSGHCGNVSERGFATARVKTRRIALARRAAYRKSQNVFTNDILELQGLTPLAKGNVRLVFAYPGRPEMVVKVMRPDPPLKRKRRVGSTGFVGCARYDPYLVFLREIREFVCGCTSSGAPLDFVQKDSRPGRNRYGTGSGDGRRTDREGRLAPTVARLIAEGKFDGSVETAFEGFRLESAGMRSRDCPIFMSATSVLAVDQGWKGIFPTDRWSRLVLAHSFQELEPSINRRSKEKRVARLRRRMARRLEAHRAGNPMP